MRIFHCGDTSVLQINCSPCPLHICFDQHLGNGSGIGACRGCGICKDVGCGGHHVGVWHIRAPCGGMAYKGTMCGRGIYIRAPCVGVAYIRAPGI